MKDSAPDNYSKNWDEIPDAVPVPVQPGKYGNPDSYVALGKTYHVMDSVGDFEETGIASWYGTKFHGRRTSSGEEYDMYAMTAAHKTLPIPVFVEVTNKENGRKAIVKVNDRGPFHKGRIIDLSYAAATKLGVAASGTARVSIRVVTPEDREKTVKPVVAENSQVVAEQRIVKSSLAESDKLYVQVAAFATEQNALKYLEKLQGQGFFDVRLHVENSRDAATNKDIPVYRVRIGPLPSQHVAKNILAQLEENNYRNLKIVNNN